MMESFNFALEFLLLNNILQERFTQLFFIRHVGRAIIFTDYRTIDNTKFFAQISETKGFITMGKDIVNDFKKSVVNFFYTFWDTTLGH